VDLFIPSIPGSPGLLCRAQDYDRFAAALGESLGEAITVRETAFLDIVPSEVALVHGIGDMAPLVKAHGKGAYRDSIFLGARRDDVEALALTVEPAGIIDSSALALWRKGRAPDRMHSGIYLRNAYFSGALPGTQLQGLNYSAAHPEAISLCDCIAQYVVWLRGADAR